MYVREKVFGQDMPKKVMWLQKVAREVCSGRCVREGNVRVGGVWDGNGSG